MGHLSTHVIRGIQHDLPALIRSNNMVKRGETRNRLTGQRTRPRFFLTPLSNNLILESIHTHSLRYT